MFLLRGDFLRIQKLHQYRFLNANILTTNLISTWNPSFGIFARMKFNLIASLGAIVVFAELSAHSAEGVTTQLQWVMNETYRDIAEMVLYARDPKVEPSRSIEFDVVPIEVRGTSKLLVEGEIGGTRVLYTTKMGSHPWELEHGYTFAKTLISQLGLKPAPSDVTTSEMDLPTLLLRPAEMNLIDQAQRVSSAISSHPLDGLLHEQAALILGVLGLGEAAGDFSDLRPVLNRMSAHLAIAKATRDELGVSGRLAQIVQLSLVIRQVEALNLIEGLPAGLSGWKQALKIRNTQDPRLLTEPEKATPLEQLEHARALVRSYDGNYLVKFLQSTQPDDLPDWGRIATEYGVAVEVGHIFSTNGPQRETRAFQEAWKKHTGEKIESDTISEKFNLPATRGLVSDGSGGHRIEVLSSGNLAAFHRRHYCRSLVSIHDFLHRSLGLPREAQRWEETMGKELRAMNWYPFVASSVSRNANRRSAAAYEAVSPYARAHPEIVPYRLWQVLSEGEKPSIAEVQLYRVGDLWTDRERWDGTWFRNSLTFSTTPNDLDSRAAYIKNLRDTAPYHSIVLLQVATWFKDRSGPPTFDVSYKPESLAKLKELLRPIENYNLKAMAWLAEAVQTTDPDDYIKRKQAICEHDPNSFFKLGDALVAAERYEEAAVAYQSGVDKATDRVTAANGVDWLVNYYFDHDRKGEAQKIADDAAKVYSAGGLRTKARLAERMGEFEKAESLYQEIDQRYPSISSYVWNFWWRLKDQSETYSKAWKDLIAENLPDGLKEVKMEQLKGEPKTGVVVDTSPSSSVNGIKNGSILVAVDGYEVENLQQFEFISKLRIAENGMMRSIMWTGESYKEENLNPYGRKASFKFTDRSSP